MEAPERNWIAPVHGATRPDDFYLIDPEYRNGRGVEYIRADLLDAHIGAVLAEAAEVARHYADADYCAMGYPEDGGIAASGTAATILSDILAIRPDAQQALERVRREARVDGMRAAYLAGFNASTFGYNSESIPEAETQDWWLEEREAAIRNIIDKEAGDD